MKMKLTQQFVNEATCPPEKNRVDYYDTTLIGLVLEARKTGGKTYYLRYRDQHGKLRQHKIAPADAVSFDKARQAAQRLKSQVVLGGDPLADRKAKRAVPTLTEFYEERYLPFIKLDKRSWKSDVSCFRCYLRPRFGSKPMDQITEQDVGEFKYGQREKGYAKGTINRGLVLLKYMYALALKWEIPGVTANPVIGTKLFEANARERYLAPEEAQRLFVAIAKSKNTQLKHIVPLLLLLGCRKSELIHSRWPDFDLERRIWRIPMSKSGKSRHVPLSQRALELLAQLPRWEGCPYVVPNPETLKPFVQIHRSWNNARQAAGLPDVRMHDLRHSMASNMINSGRSLYEVAKVLGHSQLKTTQRYAHLSQETLLAAVDAAADAANWKPMEQASA